MRALNSGHSAHRLVRSIQTSIDSADNRRSGTTAQAAKTENRGQAPDRRSALKRAFALLCSVLYLLCSGGVAATAARNVAVTLRRAFQRHGMQDRGDTLGPTSPLIGLMI